MDVPCHTSSFRQSLIEAGADGSRNLAHSQPVENHHGQDPQDNAENSEPVRLVPGRRDAEVQDCAGGIPDTVVIACDYVKPVSAWAKVTIERLSSCSGFLPSSIAALQFVAKAHFLRNYKAQRRIVDFEITCKGRKTKILARRIVLSVGSNPFNMNRRR